ncbi:MAG: enolase C-terminal domain-like protein [Tepidisphaeraceae bacterium]
MAASRWLRLRSKVKPAETIRSLTATSFRVPTDRLESDGTLQWDHTTVIVVHAEGGGHTGLGWTYAPSAAASIVRDMLADVVVGQPLTDIEANWQAMNHALRNANRRGLCAMAVSAIDIALWDLKARVLGVSLLDLFGAARTGVPVYGSGGFTSYDDQTLADQLAGWVANGISRVKMKVGREPAKDEHRVRIARRAIGDSAALFVDANGGYSRKEALQFGERFRDQANVSWFEEPVSSDDLPGLRLLRDRLPAGMDVAAGEYGDTPIYFRRMLEAGAVDCLQADATRCGGYTGFLKAAALCEAFDIPLSAHCAPQIHAHVGCRALPLRHVEYFHDHVRCDALLFAGVLTPVAGQLFPDRNRPGHGLRLKGGESDSYVV